MNVIEVFTFCTINTANEIPMVSGATMATIATAMPRLVLSVSHPAVKMISSLNRYRLSLATKLILISYARLFCRHPMLAAYT